MNFNSIRVNDTDTGYSHSIFDISDYNSGATYADLAAALAAVPESKQHGGMSIRFVTVNKTGQNVYVQYRLVSSVWSTDVRDWLSDGDSNDIEEIERRISDISKTASTSDAEEIEITTDDGKTVTSITAKRVSDENDVVEFCSENGTEVYARIGIVGDKSGLFAKNIYDINGNPISGFEIDTENEVMVIAGRKYKLIPYIEN